jgi:amino acid adenylation domain-containing protein
MKSQENLNRECVHDLVGAHAAATPNAIAIVEGYKQLTYGELDARANRLAQLLRELGVGPEAPVALCIRRSTDLVVGALGTLRAGGAYVPLDPDYPANRLSMLLNDSGARVVVTHPGAAQQLPSGNWRTVVLDAVGTATARYSGVAPQVETKPENLAYVIFTSGSTGRPKGVQITHANLMNLVRWHQRAFSVLTSDRAVLQASPGFDAAVWEVWPYLAAGASVYVVDEKVRTTPDALRDWIVAKGITISFLPTALAQLMLELQWPQGSKLRVLLTGADTLHSYPSAGLPFAFVNNYGPTECTVVTTSGTVLSASDSGELPTIGSPIDNAQIYVVDEHLQAVPTGTPGELLIGGAGVARGYLNLPELSAQKFIADPFGRNPEARLYRTGDLVRQLPDGEIAFMGRIDDQIKIRGYRIEPQEIMAVLNSNPEVKASMVVANVDASGERRLVAYVVPVQGVVLKAATLRKFLSEHLPEYMVPSMFMQLESLPLSASGKVDRAALPVPTAENVMEEEVYEAPQSEIQERLANTVRTLLGVKRVGIDDNFFNLGGHSLLGAQMIAQITETFGVELSLLSVFNDPTLRGMSAEIERLIIEKVSAMSEEEAQSLLTSSQSGN